MTASSILVVEDNPTTRKMLRVALVTEGYAVVEAGDARAALAAAESGLPDLVLQDLILPDMDGVELLRRLRALPGGAELPILALSGFLSRLESSQGEPGGFTALLVKPIEPSRLMDVIRVYLPQLPLLGSSLGEGRRLLVVDDDPVQLKLTRIHFSQRGFAVAATGSASEALMAARAHRPDVILSDVFMPGTDGFDLCLEIRRDAKLAGVPLVLLSAQYGSKADEDLAHRVGANALVLRTPDFGHAAHAILEALNHRAPMPAEQPNDHLALTHARLLIHQLEQQAATAAALALRCGIQAGQLSLLSGVAEALTQRSDPEAALRDVLAATLDAAGISKGALLLRDATGALALRQDIGFSDVERARLQNLFGHRALLEDIVDRGGSVPVPSQTMPKEAAWDILSGANVATAHIVPLISDGRGVGAMIIGATSIDVAGDDGVAFARAMGNQVVQSMELAQTVSRLAASEQRYRTLLENANDFIAVLTQDGVVREMNHRWVEFTGLSREQLIGRHVREFVPAEAKIDGDPIHDEPVATGPVGAHPIEITRPNGPRTFIEFSSTDVDVGGEQLVFTIGRDVTERRVLEQQYQQAQKMEAIGTLAGGIAHDFNNILGAMIGCTELAAMDAADNPAVLNSLAQVSAAGRRATDLVQLILAFSGQQEHTPQATHLEAVIREALALLRASLPASIELRSTFDPATPPVLADRTQVHQIVMNLGINAWHAMNDRPGMIEVTLDTVNADGKTGGTRKGRYARLSVRDTGHGMDPGTLARIFEPFFTTKAPGEGTGLGLASVHGIMKSYDGEIVVSSQPGEGSTFGLYFPVTELPVANEGAGELPLPRGDGQHILFVDDEPSLVAWGVGVLERLGYRVTGHTKVADALAVVSQHPHTFDLILTDLTMPVMTGIQFARCVRDIRPDMPVIFATGYSAAATDAAQQNGFDTVLLKPIASRTLALAVDRAVQGTR